MTAPGPAPDLAAAEQRLRDVVAGKTDLDPQSWCDVALTLAELDHTRGLIAAVLAECERRENDPTKFDLMTTERIRALLEGEKR